MENMRIAKIGFHVHPKYVSSKERLSAYLADKFKIKCRILLTLKDYLEKHSEIFHEVRLHITDKPSRLLSNGTLTGLVGEMNRSEVDVGVNMLQICDSNSRSVDFAYPYQFYKSVFVIQQPEYEPQFFGILQTFSISLWAVIIASLLVMSLIYYIALKSNYSLDKILLHIFAVILRQNSIIRPSSSAENILIYSWVIGSMFLCLAYDSVFLSFLAFPPVNPIRDLSDLSAAVKNGEYHCVTFPNSIADLWIEKYGAETEQENFRVIATDVLKNNIRFEDIFEDFLFAKRKLKLAFLTDEINVDVLIAAKKFISEDRFFGCLGAMKVRKHFCCKQLLDTFVHRLMASGLYFKFHYDRRFLLRFKVPFIFTEKDNSERVLTLTDVAPAFIFLLAGYFISFLVLILEIIYHRVGRKKMFKINKTRTRKFQRKRRKLDFITCI